MAWNWNFEVVELLTLPSLCRTALAPRIIFWRPSPPAPVFLASPLCAGKPLEMLFEDVWRWDNAIQLYSITNWMVIQWYNNLSIWVKWFLAPLKMVARLNYPDKPQIDKGNVGWQPAARCNFGWRNPVECGSIFNRDPSFQGKCEGKKQQQTLHWLHTWSLHHCLSYHRTPPVNHI